MKRLVSGIIGVLIVSACGGTTSPGTSTSGVTKQANIAAELSADMLALAPFQIATDATYAPNEFVDPDTGAIRGWDIDFGNSICTVMGVKCTFNNVTFDDIIAQLKASTPSEVAGGDKPRYELSISSWSPTQDRENSGIDFITYFRAGEVWIEKSSGGPAFNKAADMCGKTVAVEAGTTEESDAWGYIGQQVGGGAMSGAKDLCKDAGKPDIKVSSFQTQTDANTALESGRADVGFLDQPVAAYQAKTSGGKLKVVGQACSVAPYGIALVKGSKLEQAITDAVKYLMDHGYYKTILDNWGVASGAITSADVKLNDNNAVGQTCVPS